MSAAARPRAAAPAPAPASYFVRTDVGHDDCAFVYRPGAIGGVLQWTDRYVRVANNDAKRVEQMVLRDDIPGLLAYLEQHPKPAPCKRSTVEVTFDAVAPGAFK